MPIINLSNPINALIAIILFILVLFLSKEMKKSNVVAIMLLTFLTIIAGNGIEYFLTDSSQTEVLKTLANCIAVDFVFVFVSFISFLWMDDVEAKDKKIKSVDNSLDWFWKKV